MATCVFSIVILTVSLVFAIMASATAAPAGDGQVGVDGGVGLDELLTLVADLSAVFAGVFTGLSSTVGLLLMALGLNTNP